MAVVKPAGLLVHRNPGPREPAALQLVRDQLGGDHVFPVHRLDRATHGLLVFARSPLAARHMSEALTHGARKTYLAVVRGHPRFEGLLDYPLVDEDTGATQSATTTVTRLQTSELPIAVGRYPSARYALMKLEPHTGRTHQLRRHMAHLRHPIVGDVRHGDGAQNRAIRQHFGVKRMMLFASRLQFVHPFTGQTIDLTSPIDDEAMTLLRALDLVPSSAP